MCRGLFASMVVFVVLAAGCASVTRDITVETEVDPKADLTGYQSYTWAGAAALVNDPRSSWSPPGFDVGEEIRFLVDRELHNRGMKQNSVNPDMVVAFAVGVDMTALKWVKDTKLKTLNLQNVPQGALTLIFADAATDRVISIGSATADLQSSPNDEVVRKRLDYAVTRMVKEMVRKSRQGE
jgi:hypothetical protein